MNETRYHIQIIETGEVILLRLEESKELLLVDDVMDYVKNKYDLAKGSFRYVPGSPKPGFKPYTIGVFTEQDIANMVTRLNDMQKKKKRCIFYLSDGKGGIEARDPSTLY